MGMFFGPNVVLNGLIFLLDSANTKSYSGSGSTWTDLSGNGNNGTLTNSGNILHESGSHFKFNELNTTGSGYVEMGDVLTTSYTKNIWFRTNGANTNHLMSGSGGAGTTAIWCANGERFIAAGHSTNINVGSNAIVVYDSGSSTGLQTWHNACVTYSNTTMKLYVNGFLVDTGTDSDPTDAALHIAGYANASELSGDVAYASLYSRALTDDEVLKNYNALKGRFRLNTPNPAQTYSATPASSSVNEGSSLTINVATTNVGDTTLYFLNSRPADFPAASDSGSFSLTNGTGSFTVTPTSDSNTEGSETFTVAIKTGSTSGPTVATTSTITINDTSTGKIICTALNDMYGFGSFRNKLWMKYNDYDKALYPSNSEILQLGYHKVFGKLTEMMPNSPLITKALRRIARVRTDRIRREMSGKPLTFESKLHPAILRPIAYAAGWLVHKGVLKKYDRNIKRI